MVDSPGKYRCVSCGSEHSGPPKAYITGEPAGWEITRDTSSRLWGEPFDEQAILPGPEGEQGWYVRGNIVIPTNCGDQLVYTVWLSLSEANFTRAHELWTDPERVHEAAYFAWLSSVLAGYPSTMNLKTNVWWQPPGTLPIVELQPTDHPLAIEQRDGITRSRPEEIAALATHGVA